MIRNEATQRQVDAADPRASTWLTANAGSGKTRVLTDRVARLLLDDVSPQNILCLTYTKAAATEMQNRLFRRLGEWAMMPDAALTDALRELGFDGVIDAQALRKARTLFARAIETPGGLKIQTIHSFCAGVLRRFPLEAQVSPQFREMEDREAQLLRADVVDRMLLGADAAAVTAVLAQFTGDDFTKLTKEIAQHRDLFLTPRSEADLRTALAIPAGATAQAFMDEVFDPALLQSLASACAAGSKTDKALAGNLRTLLSGSRNPHHVLSQMETMFLTGSSAADPYSAKAGKLPTKATRAAISDLCDPLDDMMLRIAELRPIRLALAVMERTQVLHAFASRFVTAYEARKLAMGALDFDDLIRKAKSLLTDRDVAQWVLFRLDGGIDHILVDEAQDTSPTQWAVIEQLTQEFAAGEGAGADRARTIFVVGDKKQSIYSFQGADPDAFERMRVHFDAAQRSVGKSLVPTSLEYSFRSSQAVLSVVDAVIGGPHSSGMDAGFQHRAFKDAMPGRVDLWPAVEKDSTPDDRLWYDPVDQPSASDHNVVLATRIAEQIRYLIDHETIPEEVGNTGTYIRRKVTAGDFLILVQRRSELFSEIIRACKKADLQIAGADRLRIGGELAVRDLAALLNFLALPEDDLSLAAALRSPLFGWSEQDLFTLAHHRADGRYLWDALRNGDYPDTLAVLNDLRDNADFLRPYDLLSRILIRHGGRQKLLARLGAEAEDGIDALLSQALAFEATSIPSLTGFVSWFETEDIEIKRQMESKGDRIRVMTVHGAKGLEAPIVILPDTAKRRNEVKQDLLVDNGTVFWKPLSPQTPPPVAEMKQDVLDAQARERMRLLYVAMTRAEKWLIVAAAGETGEGDESWYSIIAEALETRGATDAIQNGLAVRRVSHLDWHAPVREDPRPTEPEDTPIPAFSPVTMPARSETLSPSDLGGAKVLPGDPGDADTEAAKARGTLVHLLLEHLPKLPPEQRARVGLRLAGGDTALVETATRLLDDPALADVWASDALTEVAITANLPDGRRIHGTIDRLLVDGDHVTAIDYKSNRLVPEDVAQTPAGLLRQMAAYRTGLMQVFPDHRISTAILWTETGRLMPIPDALLDAALDDLRHLDQSVGGT